MKVGANDVGLIVNEELLDLSTEETVEVKSELCRADIEVNDRMTSIYDAIRVERDRAWITRGACTFLGMAAGPLVVEGIKYNVTEPVFPVYLGVALAAFILTSALGMYVIFDKFNICQSKKEQDDTTGNVTSLYEFFKSEKHRERVTNGASTFFGITLGAMGSELTRLIVDKVTVAVFPVYLGFAISSSVVAVGLGTYRIYSEPGICDKRSS